MYYCDNFTEVKSIVDSFDSADAESIATSQRLFANTDVQTDLAYIKANFASIVTAIVRLETQVLASKLLNRFGRIWAP